MDLIYTNGSREDIGVLLSYELDLSFGANENDFELTVSSKHHCCEAGYYIYALGTEYGGIIDAVTSDTASGDVTYTGRTWHGILNSKVLEPDTGQDYLTVQGEANAVLAALIARCGLGSLFSVSAADSGITIPKYAMNRYISAYDGIRKMLKTVDAKLLFAYDGSNVSLSVALIVDYTEDGLNSDTVEFAAKKAKGKVNHLICLGSGELKDRTVLHLYADANGNISKTQSLFGVDEYTAVYDYSGVEDEAELEKGGTTRLKELLQQDGLEVSIDDTNSLFDIGDIVGASDAVTGVSIAVPIAQKIVTIKDGITEVSYSTDNAGSSSYSGSSGEESSGSGAAMAALNDHVNDKTNPHGVTAEQVGAAEAKHAHAIDDVTGLSNKLTTLTTNISRNRLRNVWSGVAAKGSSLTLNIDDWESGAAYILFFWINDESLAPAILYDGQTYMYASAARIWGDSTQLTNAFQFKVVGLTLTVNGATSIPHSASGSHGAVNAGNTNPSVTMVWAAKIIAS